MKKFNLYAMAGIICGMVYLGLILMISMIVGFLNMVMHWQEPSSN